MEKNSSSEPEVKIRIICHFGYAQEKWGLLLLLKKWGENKFVLTFVIIRNK